MVYQPPGQILRNGSGVVAKEFKDCPHIAEGWCRPPFLPIGNTRCVRANSTRKCFLL